MNFFMSGELGGENSGKIIDLIKEIENKIKQLDINDYGGNINEISIIPIIIKNISVLEENNLLKERRLVKKITGEADYRIKIDYEKFNNSEVENKKILILKNIIEAINDIGRKVEEFDNEKLEKDILDLFEIKKEKIIDI